MNNNEKCFPKTDKSWLDYKVIAKTDLSPNTDGPCNTDRKRILRRWLWVCTARKFSNDTILASVFRISTALSWQLF